MEVKLKDILDNRKIVLDMENPLYVNIMEEEIKNNFINFDSIERKDVYIKYLVEKKTYIPQHIMLYSEIEPNLFKDTHGLGYALHHIKIYSYSNGKRINNLFKKFYLETN